MFLVVGFGWVFFVDDSGDLPVHQGKTVEEWFYGEKGHSGTRAPRDAVAAAFEKMGPNCVPFLIQNLRKKDTRFGKFYEKHYSKFPNFWQSRTRPPESASYIQMITFIHLRKLPASAVDPHALELMAVFPEIQDPDRRFQSLDTVQTVALRREPHEKIAFFSGLLEDSDFRLRLQAAVMLSRIDKTLTNGVPILIEGSTNRALMTSSFPQRREWLSPGRLPVNPDQAMIHQEAAHRELMRISPALAEKHPVQGPKLPKRAEVPALLRALSSSDVTNRVRAGSALAKLYRAYSQAGKRDPVDLILYPFAERAATGGGLDDAAITEALARVEETGEDWDQAIQDALKDPIERVRVVAIHRLGSRGDKNVSAESLRMLVEARAETGLDILNAISKAIRQLRKNGAPIDEQLDLALAQAPDFESQLDLIFETDLATADAVVTLRGILKSGSPKQRVRSAELLGQRAEIAADSVPELVEALKSGEGELRYQAVRALTELGPRAAAAAPALEDDSIMVQRAARRALGRIRE